MLRNKILLFCPICRNVLIMKEGQKCYRFASATWENVDSTAETCPKCEHALAYFMQIQTRSADEPMTTFYKCCSSQCGHCWRD
uniref:DNA-directed RNA polymerase III subunit RPC10 n=1 Tax=Erpetoichthys calabaricus TaxID=27687 RepID=A0A8C4RNT4_ERPCA